MLHIDGSQGEGGGQILRSSLALSLITGKPVRLENIRAGRAKPGLMRQHLTAVLAAAEIGNAETEGAEIGSKTLTFHPGKVRGGDYHFAVGTAGSVTLVLQTVLPALLTASEKSVLVLDGGTHNPYAPPFDFLAKSFLPQIKKMGAKVDVQLEHYGFYPAGGGRFTVQIDPVEWLKPLNLLERGDEVSHQAKAIVALLPPGIAERELKVVKRKLGWENEDLHIEELSAGRGPGNILFIETAYTNVTGIFTGFGEKNVRAEAVAERAIKQYRRYVKTDVPVGEYLADQLILPIALAGHGEFRTLPLSKHAETNIEVVRQFLDVDISIEQESEVANRIRVSS